MASVGTTALVDALADAVVVIDTDATVVWGNRAAERMLGRERETWIGASGLTLVHPDDVALAALALESVQDKEFGTPIELRLATADGWRLVELIGAPLPDGCIAISARDLTARRRWEVATDETAAFRSVVQHAAMITALVRVDGTVASVSGAVTRMLGHDPEAVSGALLRSIVHPDDRSLVDGALQAAIRRPSGAPPVVVEVDLVAEKGRRIPFELTIVSLIDDPTVAALVVSANDISRLRSAQDALAELAHFDSLTGVANRRSFEAALHREWTLTARDGVESYVVVIDLDGFKQLNDAHGHAAGDEALRRLAMALRASTRETDVIARIGGDEFAVILIRCGGPVAVERFERDLRDRLVQCLDGLPAPVAFTAGAASLRGTSSPEDALNAADLEMLSRKRAGRA